jgi:hypothetical protein
MEFKKTEISATIYGTAYKLRRPSVKEAQEYSAKVKAAGEEDSSKCLLEMLEMCGLPIDVAMGMEADHLVQLVEGMMPSKKK